MLYILSDRYARVPLGRIEKKKGNEGRAKDIEFSSIEEVEN